MEARRQRSRSVYSLIDLIDGRRLRTVRRAHRKKLRGCIYARYSTKFQDSIEDQVRTCRKWAEEHDIEVTDVHVYSDVARTGKARRRKGLEAMLAALDRGEIDVVITFATNRLNRRIHLALQFVEEEIVEKRRRCVFVAQNIDTEDTKFWKQLLYVFAMVDEFQVQMSAGHIRAAHIGLLLKRRIHGTLTFGYTGVPIPGEFTRRGHPQRRWEINPETQDWVKQIFEWYVFEHRRFRWIARELRKRHAPPPPKVERWSRGAVRHVLTNRRYIGDWSYGWRETVWQSKADYGRQYLKDKPTQEHREESLRIISDSLFFAAQELLNKRRGAGGRPRQKGERPRDPLLEVMWCPKHQRYLRPYSGDGHLLACPKCKAGDGEEPCLFSVLNRDLARRILYAELAMHTSRLRADARVNRWRCTRGILPR